MSEPRTTGIETVSATWRIREPELILKIGAEGAEQGPGVEADCERRRREGELAGVSARVSCGHGGSFRAAESISTKHPAASASLISNLLTLAPGSIASTSPLAMPR